MSNASEYLVRGDEYQKNGDFDKAIANYTEAIRINPNFAEAYYFRGQAYLDMGDANKAIAEYTEAVRIDSNYLPAYYARGVAYGDKGDWDKAIADFTEIIRIDHNNEGAYYGRGEAYNRKGNHDLAIADLTEAIRLDPTDKYCYFGRGMAYSEKGDLDRAIADFNEAIRLDPNSEFAASIRDSISELKAGKTNKDDGPTNANEQFNLGKKYREGSAGLPKDKEKAVYWFTKAAEQGHDWAMCALGIEYYYGLDGVPRDREKANYWNTKAAEQGNTSAMYRLGINYYLGEGVSKDIEKSKHWLALATERGNKDAKKALNRLNAGKSPKKSGGCYVATCVYGSYDCPEVWTLRRYRDSHLSKSWLGRLFIRIYYAVSPKIVESFGDKYWFNSVCKPIIDNIVCTLQNNGVDSSPYSDGYVSGKTINQ